MRERMGRRTAIAGLAGSMISATAANAQTTATPQSSERVDASSPADNSAVGYLWAATTWYELSLQSQERFRDAADAMGDDWEMNLHAPDIFAEMGVWKGLFIDIKSVTPPPEHLEFHNFLTEKMENLDRASRYYIDGIILKDMELVRRGSDYFSAGYLSNRQMFEDGYEQNLINRSRSEVSARPDSDLPVAVEQSQVVTTRGEFTLPEDLFDLSFATGPTVGDSKAPVTMHIFSDFQCHFCLQFYDDTLPQIIDDFVKTGQLKLVYHDFPRLGTDPNIADPNNLEVEMRDSNNESAAAAHAAMCAGEQDKYLNMIDMLFGNYGGVQQGGFARAKLNRFAEIIDLDMNAFGECMDSGRYMPALARSVAHGQANGITATPMFILDNGNGKPNVVQQTAEGYALLKKQIELSIATSN